MSLYLLIRVAFAERRATSIFSAGRRALPDERQVSVDGLSGGLAVIKKSFKGCYTLLLLENY